MIRGDDGISRWRRVADGLRQMIADGDAGLQKLPTEAELAIRFQVNRHTVRRAISVLAAEGLVRTERGRGTFFDRLPERIAYPLGPRTRFSQVITAQARQPSGRLIASGREAADAKVAALLDLRTGEAVYRLESLHVADSLPLSVATSWFPAARFPDIVAAYADSGSITTALAAHCVADYRRRETRITAERIAPRDAEPLACPADALVIVTVAVNVDPEDRPIQAARSRFVADRIELVVTS